MAQFKEPLLVTERNVLLEFNSAIHDNIVLDKMVPADVFSLCECEALTDFTQPAHIKRLYRCARIPKHTRKIIVTNRRYVLPSDPLGQLLGRRVVQLEIRSPLFLCAPGSAM